MSLKSLMIGLLAAAWLTPALAQSPQSTIRVDGAWARPTAPAAKTAAAYLTLTNTGGGADRLLSASTPVAGETDVHKTVGENGVMKMRPAGPLDVKPGAPVVFKPGGLHVMMMDLKQPLKEGQSFPLTLVFEKAGKIETSVHVQKGPAAAAMPMNMGGQMNTGSGQMKMDQGKMGH